MGPPLPLPWTAPRPLPDRLETPRLLLRYWVPEDAGAMLAAIDVDRASLLPWLPWVVRDNRTAAECLFNIERFRRTRENASGGATDYVVGMFDRVTGATVGGTGYHRIDLATGEAEIGYWVRADRRREGLCTEATAALVSWGLTPQARGGWGFRRIQITCAAGNLGSRGVPRALGMRQEVHRRADRWIDDLGWDDTLGWGVLAEEWDGASGRVRR